jgi:glutamine synthetase
MTDALTAQEATTPHAEPRDRTRADAVVADLREREIETVILAGCDTYGVMRGKRVPIDQLARLLEHGMPMCDVFWVMHIDESELVARPADHIGYFPTERNGYPDVLAVPDLETVRVVPWHHRTALLLCDWALQDGAPVPIAPRGVLQRVVERARAMGFEPYCGLELEFYALRETSGSLLSRHASELVPLDERPSTYGVVTGSRQEPFARQIRERMLAYGLPIEACNPETGPGQFEINLRYAPALAAADAAFLFKAGVKELAAQDGLMATFMAKPNADWAGNSCHIHISLRDGGRAVFHDPEAAHGISSTMRHFVGGTLAAMADLTAVFAPNPNSYRRFHAYSWAGTTATWGLDNRSTGLRAVCEGAHGTRIEHRQAGGDVNPYLGAAAALAGGLDGIERGIEPPALVDADVYGMAPGAVPELPRTLAVATERLAGSELARRWLGEDFVAHYVQMKRAEVEAQSRAVTDWEIARYLEAL